MLQVLLGDDEHTGEIGPYQRLMKNRKWVFLSSGAMIACTSGLYDPAAEKTVLKVISLPLEALEMTLATALSYVVIQNLLLLGQLSTCYSIVLVDRFSERRAEERAAATTRYRDAQKQLSLLESADKERLQALHEKLTEGVRVAQGSLNRTQKELETSRAQNRADDPSVIAGLSAQKDDLSRAQSVLQKHISSLGVDGKSSEMEAASRDVAVAYDELSRINETNAALRPGYRAFEIAIDVIRLVPAPVIGIVAFIHWFITAPHIPLFR